MLEAFFSKQNVEEALLHLLSKRNVRDHTGMLLSDLPEYWQINRDVLYQVIGAGCYLPMDVKVYYISKKNGGRRRIADIAYIDLLLYRMLYQSLSPLLTPAMAASCFAYMPDRSVPEAVQQIKAWIEESKGFCARLDIHDFFDSIPIDRICAMLTDRVGENPVTRLAVSLLHARVAAGQAAPAVPSKGLLQGSPLSPLLSNLYLSSFDARWQGHAYLRYADDILFFTADREEAQTLLAEAAHILKEEYGLQPAPEKCGVSEALEQAFLGYSFRKYYGHLLAEPLARQQQIIHDSWQTTPFPPNDKNLWINQEGELVRRDYALTFNGDNASYVIPPENVDTIHLLERVHLSTSLLEYADQKHIRLCFYDRHGEYIGDFLPRSMNRSAQMTIAQVKAFSDPAQRIRYAIPLLCTAFHSMLFLIRHYYKEDSSLRNDLDEIKQYQTQAKKAADIAELMLIEARARQSYYHAISVILEGMGFSFSLRTRRPPRDPVNAMMSFGNTVLYQRIATEIYKAGLDIRFSFLHASQEGRDSLNLDIAEIFKPLLVDRAVLSLIKRHEILHNCFDKTEDEGIHLNKTGKRIFLNELQKRLFTCVNADGKRCTWQTIIKDEIYRFKDALTKQEKYRPYHHR